LDCGGKAQRRHHFAEKPVRAIKGESRLHPPAGLAGGSVAVISEFLSRRVACLITSSNDEPTVDRPNYF
jgi:hypothetical protein